jgi:isoleucyl-tRNA synthetase
MTSPRFDKVAPVIPFPELEAEIRRFWKEEDIFHRSLAQREDCPRFTFYEGPPTANGLPHNGHVLTRVIKDLFPRYKTMCGYYAPRKAGWDTHGLPVEIEVEKQLRIRGKQAIEDYGIEPFVRLCQKSVFQYTAEWEKLTEDLGFWVDLENAYVTYHESYVQSVWWALSELFKKGLLYRGHKVVWWWAQGGTALSQAEVGEGYKEVDDPSIYVRFPLLEEGGGLSPASLLVWTTTPWTLSSNSFAAVKGSITYAEVEDPGDDEGVAARTLIMAEVLVASLAEKVGRDLTVQRTFPGTELVGRAYEPPFDWFAKREAHDALWKVIDADFVEVSSGTGIVHMAPAFGEEDFAQLQKLQQQDASVPLLNAVLPDGGYDPEIAPERYAGRWVKQADSDLSRDLKEADLCWHLERVRHDYPFCVRSDKDPLIQYARPAWYIRTTDKIDEAIAINQKIHWLPEHIKNGRFGDFLANNQDWALSRERFWGTPLNIWINDVTGAMDSPASVADILERNPNAFEVFDRALAEDPDLCPDLRVHKPWIDEVAWQKPGEEGTYRRVSEVIDCWFDSGCMPFAQWGYPHQGEEEYKANFPADFISEAIDQTRGWFYSQLMVSSLLNPGLEDPHPYQTCLVLGHVQDRHGKKESKSKGNYTSPEVILDRVRMGFAVIDGVGDVAVEAGQARIAREDYEGLDFRGETAQVQVYRDTNPESALTLTLIPAKLPRRVIALSEADRKTLGAALAPSGLSTRPVEVPQLEDH